MLAGPDSTSETMTYALADTIHALDAASELDLDRSADDRKFFAARKELLAPLLTQLIAARRAVEDHDIGDGSRLQLRVEMGDQVLDRGVGDGNARTKLAQRGKAGLDATHVFGKNVATLTKEKIALEPKKVLEAVIRLDDLPDFPEKKAIAEDLTKRAEQQQACLDERDAGDATRSALVGKTIKLVVDTAHALAALKGALDERFPRQRDYVATFFADVSPRRKAKADAAGEAPAEETKAPASENGAASPA
ncbi:hypothetical protein A7982_12726 [Minicystis rosea]|nr:hypothetical protein A7982_12726 [Minicystis rosea]